MNLRTNLASLLAFFVVALAGGWAIHASSEQSSDTLYRNSLASCERGNSLREESNLRVPAHRTEATVVLQFLRSARTARLASYAETHSTNDKIAAREYGRLANRLVASVHFDPLPLIHCKDVIEAP